MIAILFFYYIIKTDKECLGFLSSYDDNFRKKLLEYKIFSKLKPEVMFCHNIEDVLYMKHVT